MRANHVHERYFEVRESSRRAFLRTFVGLGIAAGLPQTQLYPQSVNRSTARRGRIDIHHHFVPPKLAALGAVPRGFGGDRFPWTPERTLEQMEKFDIAIAILSMTQMGDFLYDNTEKGRVAVRDGNDYGAKVRSDHPKRFGQFTAVPLPDIDGVMKEIEYGLDSLKADGIGIYTNDNQGRWPGDPYFDPMWQELDRRRAIVYMHLLAPPCCRNLNDSAPYTMHSGGTMPMIAGRIKDRYPHDAKHDEYIPGGVIAELQKFYIDVAHATFPYPMAALMKFALPDHVLFGTDYPFEPVESTVDELPGLGLPAEVMRRIERENTERLFPRLAG